ncbi:hypothetical protein [Polyangium sp. 6x1]|uniref:hypothetical protein n=1 Tax=Polyangium sp. 6x1 TaxID=3042689 RepID=UPI0024829C94|nr:hypothetical protein [Polyangium sp. 6x1]MDI1450644.1 hypothetical protein [Polyangium sp. 6x1]
MTRRKKLIAAALTLPFFLALGVGLTVRRAGSDPLSADVCDKDLAAVFDYCEADGEVCKVFEGQEEACQAGCVMKMCPNHVACTELDPIWCKPCDDVEGALHWRIRLEAERQCQPSPGWQPSNYFESFEYHRCAEKKAERMCPALADKPDWYESPEAKKQQRERCNNDFDLRVRSCENDERCALEPEEYKKACQEGCLRAVCPDQFPCTGDDPVRCAPCEDVHGARHWRKLSAVEGLCTVRHPFLGPNPDPIKWADCVVAEMEQVCPALAGTEWWRQNRTITHHYGNARPSTAPPASPDTP